MSEARSEIHFGNKRVVFENIEVEPSKINTRRLSRRLLNAEVDEDVRAEFCRCVREGIKNIGVGDIVNLQSAVSGIHGILDNNEQFSNLRNLVPEMAKELLPKGLNPNQELALQFFHTKELHARQYTQ